MGEGSSAFERLAQAVLERGITVCPTRDGSGLHISVAEEKKEEDGFDVEREGRLGRWW